MPRSTSGAGLGRGRPSEEDSVVLKVVASMSSYRPRIWNDITARRTASC